MINEKWSIVWEGRFDEAEGECIDTGLWADARKGEPGK
jgi:hypothetical protein